MAPHWVHTQARAVGDRLMKRGRKWSRSQRFIRWRNSTKSAFGARERFRPDVPRGTDCVWAETVPTYRLPNLTPLAMDDSIRLPRDVVVRQITRFSPQK